MARAERTFVIVNALGMHARPAAMLVQTANRFQADVIVENTYRTPRQERCEQHEAAHEHPHLDEVRGVHVADEERSRHDARDAPERRRRDDRGHGPGGRREPGLAAAVRQPGPLRARRSPRSTRRRAAAGAPASGSTRPAPSSRARASRCGS